MDGLSSLPLKILYLIMVQLEYTSEVDALARTSRYLSSIATSPYLYPRYVKLCSPHGLDRLVASGSVGALRRPLANGVDLKRYLNYCRGHGRRPRTDG